MSNKKSSKVVLPKIDIMKIFDWDMIESLVEERLVTDDKPNQVSRSLGAHENDE